VCRWGGGGGSDLKPRLGAQTDDKAKILSHTHAHTCWLCIDGCAEMSDWHDWAQLLAVSCELESVWQTRAGDVQSTQAAQMRCGAPAFAGYRIS